MSRNHLTNMDDDRVPFEDTEVTENRDDADLWFLPGQLEDEPDYLPPGPVHEAKESDVVDAWRAAEAGQAAQLARVAARLGILDERLRRGPAGWRQRLPPVAGGGPQRGGPARGGGARGGGGGVGREGVGPGPRPGGAGAGRGRPGAGGAPLRAPQPR